MTGLASIGAIGTLLVSLLSQAAQEQPKIVNLKIIHDGRERPVPDHIKLSLDGHSLEISVRDGKFEVPSEFVAAARVTFEVDVDGSHIRLSELPGQDFGDEKWTLRLAEHADDSYEWPGPKKSHIPSTCMLELDSVREEPARVYFEEHCRSNGKSASNSLEGAHGKASLPDVVRASVPFYPELARQTRIQGTVTLRVSTDGKLVSGISSASGHPILVEAATDNVKTWEFKPHAPTSFEVTFRYKLFIPECDSECNCGLGEGGEKESVVLHMPTDADLSAPTLLTCDPAVEIRRKKSIFARLFHRAH